MMSFRIGFYRTALPIALTAMLLPSASWANQSSPQLDSCTPFLHNIFVLLGDIPVGTRCQTSRGGIFERVDRTNFGQAWKDPSGRIWSDTLTNLNFSSATQFCKALCATLPSQSDFEQESALEFQEVLPNLTTGFWTSTPAPESSDAMITFDAKNSAFTAIQENDSRAVRCVTIQTASSSPSWAE